MPFHPFSMFILCVSFVLTWLWKEWTNRANNKKKRIEKRNENALLLTMLCAHSSAKELCFIRVARFFSVDVVPIFRRCSFVFVSVVSKPLNFISIQVPVAVCWLCSTSMAVWHYWLTDWVCHIVTVKSTLYIDCLL